VKHHLSNNGTRSSEIWDWKSRLSSLEETAAIVDDSLTEHSMPWQGIPFDELPHHHQLT
jgi:hypothetical protein